MHLLQHNSNSAIKSVLRRHVAVHNLVADLDGIEDNELAAGLALGKVCSKTCEMKVQKRAMLGHYREDNALAILETEGGMH